MSENVRKLQKFVAGLAGAIPELRAVLIQPCGIIYAHSEDEALRIAERRYGREGLEVLQPIPWEEAPLVIRLAAEAHDAMFMSRSGNCN